MTSLLCVAALLLAQSTTEGKADKSQQATSPTPADANTRSADTSQRGSHGSTAGGEERSGKPGAGIESGDANGLAGGRTDEGPAGGTGIRGALGEQHERARAKANSQRRGRNRKGSLERPAEAGETLNQHPRAMGSGAPNIPVDQEPKTQGKNYRETDHKGAQPENPSGASPHGIAGKSHRTQPDAEKKE